MSTGTIESIANSLTMLVSIGQRLATELATLNNGKASPGGTPTPTPTPTTTTDDTDTDDTPPARATKKTAAKKTASKKTAAKKGGGEIDLTTFKKRMFDAAESSGVDDVMPKLKAFLKQEGYATSDEIEPGARGEFINQVKDHFAELAGGDEGGEDEIDI